MEQNRKQGSQASRIVRYSVAVAASVIGAAALIFAYNFYRLSADRVFQQYYIKYELGIQKDDTDQSIIKKEYRLNNYKGVTVLAEHAKPNELLLAGISFLQINNTQKAIETLRQISNDSAAALKDESDYYLALAYIRNKDFDQALDILHQIHDNPAHRYNKKVTPKFLRKVKMLKWR